MSAGFWFGGARKWGGRGCWEWVERCVGGAMRKAGLGAQHGGGLFEFQTLPPSRPPKVF